MIGYYVHHHGRGHLHRAIAFAAAWRARNPGEEVTGLSTLPPPPGWRGDWLRLDRDDEAACSAEDPTARGRLHWVPRGDPGLCSRAAAVSGWIDEVRPRAVVVDVSVETVLLVRLHGVPVVSVLQPGRRDDAAHLTGLRVADAVVCPWPAAAEGRHGRRMLPHMPRDIDDRAVRIGAVCRFDAVDAVDPVDGQGPSALRHGKQPRVAVLEGTGGPGMLAEAAGKVLGPSAAASARAGEPSSSRGRAPWTWQSLARGATWSDDPVPFLASSQVVVTHAGGGALADVAAARVPAVVVAGERPFDEQRVAAAVLAAGPWPVVVRETVEDAVAPESLEAASRLDGRSWAGWMDGSAARFAEVVDSVALPSDHTGRCPG